MDHSAAEKIYNEIKNEPYLVSTELGIEAPNCYFKGLRLIKSLSELGYAARGRVADIDWKDTPVPSNITDLIPETAQERHFFVETLIDDQWRTLDPSIDPKTEKSGFRSVDFNGDNRTCFDCHKIYTHSEQVKFLTEYSSNDSGIKYFQEMQPFLLAVNEWFTNKRNAL